MNAAYRKLLRAFGFKLRYWARWFGAVGGARGVSRAKAFCSYL